MNTGTIKNHNEKDWALIGSVIAIDKEFIKHLDTIEAKERQIVYEKIWLVKTSKSRDEIVDLSEKLNTLLEFIIETKTYVDLSTVSYSIITKKIEKLEKLKKAIDAIRELDPETEIESRYEKIRYHVVNKEVA
jgi:hypothetical protein